MPVNQIESEKFNGLVSKITQFLESDFLNDAECIPYFGEFVQAANVLNKTINNKKLYAAWRCFAEDENIEKSVNELYNYVNNEERAFYVADCFRKIAWSNSKIAASIIGLMLGEIKSANREFSYDDVVLFNALEYMTDFDIRNFKSIMEGNFIATDDVGRKYFDVSLFPDDKREDYLLTLTFGERHRILSSIQQALKGKTVQFSTFYTTNKFSAVLLKYINKVNQILNYGM